MNAAFIIVVLALVWAGSTGTYSGLNLLFGAVLGGVALLLLRDQLTHRHGLRRAKRVVSLALLFFRELVVSAVRVALLVMRPDMARLVRPAIIAVPLTVTSDAEITLLANLVTLTPGTLSVDVSADRQQLFVHVLTLYDREGLVAGIVNGFEKKVREVYE